MRKAFIALVGALVILVVLAPSVYAKGELETSEGHRSAVAEAVGTLLDAADRAGGIGPQVRELAREQEALHSDVAEKMHALETRSALRTFLIGSDYRSLGELRSTLVTSENGIAVLKKAYEKASASARPTIAEQIAALEAENARAREFIAAQEGKFSLFGWLAKLLVP